MMYSKRAKGDGRLYPRQEFCQTLISARHGGKLVMRVCCERALEHSIYVARTLESRDN